MKVRLKNKEIITVQYQEYSSGLYVCIYGSNGLMREQFTLNISKDEFVNAVKNNEFFKGEYIEENVNK